MLTVSSGFKTAIKHPAVYSDGKVDIGNYGGAILNNLFNNGNTGAHYNSYFDFSDTVNVVTTSYLGLESVFGGTSSSSVKFITSKSNYNIKGHKFYFKMDYKTISADNSMGVSFDFGASNVGGFSSKQITGYPNTWVVYDRFFQADALTDNLSTAIALWVYVNQAPLNEMTVTVFMDNFVLVDLTQAYGVGNEPTYEECQTLFGTNIVGSFFDVLDLTEFVPVVSFGSDSLKKIEVFGTAYNNEKVIGNIAQHVLELEILGNQTGLIPRNTNLLIQPYIGVKVDSTFEYVKYQDFIIDEVKHSDTTNITTVTAIDKLIMLNKEFVDSITYPVTLKVYTQTVLADCGLELHNTTFVNDTFSITTQPFEDYTTVREIIEQIAELSGTFVMINKVTNKVEFVPAFETLVSDETLTKSNYYKLKFSAHNFGSNGINTCVIKISQVDGENNAVNNPTNVAIDGAIEVVITDNQFVKTETLRLSVIDAIFDAMDGYKYEPYTMEYRGYPYLEIGDCITVTKMDNTTVLLPIYETSIKYNGGLKGTLSANALSKSQTDFKNIDKIDRAKRFAQIMVDKANAEISLKVSKNSVVASINLSPEVIKISAAKLELSGLVTITNIGNGTTSVDGSNIKTGTIHADRIAAGSIAANKLSVSSLSSISASLGSITGGSINIGGGKFIVNSSGVLTARSGTIGGASFNDANSGSLTLGGGLYASGGIVPNSDNAYNLGYLGSRWVDVWAADGTINTSDKTEKENIKRIEHGLEFIRNIKPVQFNWKNKERIHYGFIAQDVKKAMTKSSIPDAAIFIDPVAIGRRAKKGLRYSEFIAPAIMFIQDLDRRVKALENARN